MLASSGQWFGSFIELQFNSNLKCGEIRQLVRSIVWPVRLSFTRSLLSSLFLEHSTSTVRFKVRNLASAIFFWISESGPKIAGLNRIHDSPVNKIPNVRIESVGT